MSAGLGSIGEAREVGDDPPEGLDQEVVFPPGAQGDENKIGGEESVRTAIANPHA
ncbi:MAG: hypothetical protein H6Q44_1771, partial [Deltaproteobacteria bacterium]|nr:hypothetical protein [Deltaproteobacteria bacterium]